MRFFNKPAKPAETKAIPPSAVDGITDEHELAEIAKNSNDRDTRIAAARKITDQTILADVVENSKYPNCYSVSLALRAITDQAILARFGRDCKDNYIRKNAILALTDHKLSQELLLDMAKTCTNDSYRTVAAQALDDKALADQCLADVVRTAESSLYSSEALAAISDPALKAQLQGIVDQKNKDNDAYNREHNSMPLKCPNCGAVVMIVNQFNMNKVYENFDKNDSGLCPSCGHKYR